VSSCAAVSPAGEVFLISLFRDADIKCGIYEYIRCTS
jgi:hypothetical protein